MPKALVGMNINPVIYKIKVWRMRPSVVNRNCIVSCQHVSIHLQVTTRTTSATGLHAEHTTFPCHADPRMPLGLPVVLNILPGSTVFQRRCRDVRPSWTAEPRSCPSALWREVHGALGCSSDHWNPKSPSRGAELSPSWRLFRIPLLKGASQPQSTNPGPTSSSSHFQPGASAASVPLHFPLVRFSRQLVRVWQNKKETIRKPKPPLLSFSLPVRVLLQHTKYTRQVSPALAVQFSHCPESEKLNIRCVRIST